MIKTNKKQKQKTIYELWNINMSTVRISLNADKYFSLVKQFTGWQTKVYNYRMATQAYCDTNKLKINLPSQSGRNWWASPSHVKPTVILGTSKKACFAELQPDVRAACHLTRNQANFVYLLKEIWNLNRMLNRKISRYDPKYGAANNLSDGNIRNVQEPERGGSFG